MPNPCLQEASLRVWVGIGAAGFFQPVVFPDPPLFCSNCRRLGHSAGDCKKKVMAAATPGGQSRLSAPLAPPAPIWRPVFSTGILPAPGIPLTPLAAGASGGPQACSNPPPPIIAQKELLTSGAASVDPANSGSGALAAPLVPLEATFLSSQPAACDCVVTGTIRGGPASQSPCMLAHPRHAPSVEQIDLLHNNAILPPATFLARLPLL